jgi:hypothetical protein
VKVSSRKFRRAPQRRIETRRAQNRTIEDERQTTMKTTTKNTGIKVTTNVKAGSITPNHVRSGLAIKAGIKAGYICKMNHARLIATTNTAKKNTGIKVTTNVKAGSITPNHVRSGLAIKAGIKAGYICKMNHARLIATTNTAKKNTGIKVTTNVRAGSITPNHVRSGLAIKAAAPTKTN